MNRAKEENLKQLPKQIPTTTTPSILQPRPITSITVAQHDFPDHNLQRLHDLRPKLHPHWTSYRSSSQVRPLPLPSGTTLPVQVCQRPAEFLGRLPTSLPVISLVHSALPAFRIAQQQHWINLVHSLSYYMRIKTRTLQKKYLKIRFRKKLDTFLQLSLLPSNVYKATKKKYNQ